MKILSPEGSSFTLSIMGYQFPDLVSGNPSTNWLFAKIIINIPPQSFTIIDPCLETEDIDKMIEWFQQLREGDYHVVWCTFTEPIIVFEVFESSEHVMNLRIEIRKEYHFAKRPYDTLVIEVPLINLQFGEILASLDQWRQKYPSKE
jgi:hypothetical protein